MSDVVALASGCLLVAGGLFCVVGGIGLMRMPDFYTRVHAASVTDTLGVGLILLGLMLQAGFTLVAAKLAIIGMLIFFASPVATHALAKAAMTRGIEPLLGRRSGSHRSADRQRPADADGGRGRRHRRCSATCSPSSCWAASTAS